ncbi:MAG: hypothetical protein ABEJ65_10880 [bacterium]
MVEDTSKTTPDNDETINEETETTEGASEEKQETDEQTADQQQDSQAEQSGDSSGGGCFGCLLKGMGCLTVLILILAGGLFGVYYFTEITVVQDSTKASQNAAEIMSYELPGKETGIGSYEATFAGWGGKLSLVKSNNQASKSYLVLLSVPSLFPGTTGYVQKLFIRGLKNVVGSKKRFSMASTGTKSISLCEQEVTVKKGAGSVKLPDAKSPGGTNLPKKIPKEKLKQKLPDNINIPDGAKQSLKGGLPDKANLLRYRQFCVSSNGKTRCTLVASMGTRSQKHVKSIVESLKCPNSN